ncbi:aminotransferase class I/II-fold pyridoxal phosphate-dependent enzyme [Paenibacillus sp. IB182496]|uniref:Aminotransferase class I/II-fold pyridoxal phosphate-dependent enzyme n=1 Tax=Paenibacillus sabuli TaxID=2772509 RepID=A0A927BRU2_9BACL|nr:aminotransferase class I/II-fold pyridoxal phosphate-dependent enzyme [Paenibacillus sabuli]MBD2844510.1 aminotransferase class I/II-fold pyridoxal phosphate-dependent enzyme [Paenibacillus sabuli]
MRSDAAQTAGRIVEAVRRSLPRDCGNVQLHEPRFGPGEHAAVLAALAANYVSSAGTEVKAFERELAAAAGAHHAVALSSGTAALHLALLLSGVEPGDEVLMPSLTFVATANAAAYCGAMPHFADCSPHSLALDSHRLAAWLEQIAVPCGDGYRNRVSGRPMRALVLVHPLGHPVDTAPYEALCRRYGLALVEDAAAALGSRLYGRPVGSASRLAAISFNGNKLVTTGGGGAILTSDSRLAQTARHVSSTAKLPHRWASRHDRLGYNYRMPALSAALGRAQLARLPVLLAAKRSLASRYRDAFRELTEVELLEEPPHAESNYWLNTLLLSRPHPRLREAVLDALHAAGLGARPLWTPLHRLPMYRRHPRMPLPETDRLWCRAVHLPSSYFLAGEEPTP